MKTIENCIRQLMKVKYIYIRHMYLVMCNIINIYEINMQKLSDKFY